jgi:hypothetical protein
MKPQRIANRDCREYVQKRRLFEGSNLFSIRKHIGSYPRNSETYTVYSYGYHYPMFLYTGGMWFENASKYSSTASKHRSQAHPHTDTFKLSSEAMRYLDNHGYTKFVAHYVTTGEMA